MVLVTGTVAHVFGRHITARAPGARMLSPQEQAVPRLNAAGGINFEDIATIPKPGSQGLGLVAFSPDDRYVTFLRSPDGGLSRLLYAYDRQTGVTRPVMAPSEGGGEEGTFSKEEQLRRERQRIMSTGVTEYYWAKKADVLLVPKDGALFVQAGCGEGAESTLRRLFDPTDAAWAAVGSGPLLDPKLSEDGQRVYFVWDSEVCYVDVGDAGSAADSATPVRLTRGARGTDRTNGVADYCAQEEMNRYTGYWPSGPASDFVAFEEVDEAHSARQGSQPA